MLFINIMKAYISPINTDNQTKQLGEKNENTNKQYR